MNFKKSDITICSSRKLKIKNRVATDILLAATDWFILISQCDRIDTVLARDCGPFRR